jgi:protein ImuB
VPEEPFEGTLELEWPIEGLEPLSFVLARLFEPLSERLERADRGAAILHTHLRLTTRDVYARTVQLPAPMRDPKTLRTLVLLDLESNPPSAGIDRVRVLVEPTPAKVLQWTLYERAQPSPEQVSTLVARLTALMGDGHVGSPALVDSWKPGVFEMTPFQIREQGSAITDQAAGNDGSRTCATALRRFRLPIPARVQMHDGRPVRIMVDRRGVAGGAVEQSAGPWRTSGEWWNDATGFPEPATSERAPQVLPPNHAWDRDEWDVLVAGGAAYRIFVERGVGQWFIEGVID